MLLQRQKSPNSTENMKTFQVNDFCGPVSNSNFEGFLTPITSLTRMLPVRLLIKKKKKKEKANQDLYCYEHLKQKRSTIHLHCKS